MVIFGQKLLKLEFNNGNTQSPFILRSFEHGVRHATKSRGAGDAIQAAVKHMGTYYFVIHVQMAK